MKRKASHHVLNLSSLKSLFFYVKSLLINLGLINTNLYIFCYIIVVCDFVYVIFLDKIRLI